MANERLSHGEFAGARDLVDGLEVIAHECGIDEGGAAFAIFRSLTQTSRYYLPDQPSERLVIAAQFCLLPFVADGFTPHDFFALVVNRKHIRLFHFINEICKELPLPAGVPANLDAAGGFDQPDHDLINRSSAGPSIGAMSGVQFGTLSDREALPAHVRNFFAMVDRELKVALCGKPLLLPCASSRTISSTPTPTKQASRLYWEAPSLAPAAASPIEHSI
jgi:hypothetical protein